MITKSTLIEEFGSAAALARAVGVSPQAVSKWNDAVPLSSVLAVSQATGYSLHELRPDLFARQWDPADTRVSPAP